MCPEVTRLAVAAVPVLHSATSFTQVRFASGVVSALVIPAPEQESGAIFVPVIIWAVTLVIGNLIKADCPILARFVSIALVDFMTAVGTLISGMALAAVAVDQVNTLPMVAVVPNAVIDVILAISSIEATGADANISACSFIAEPGKQTKMVDIIERMVGTFKAGRPILAGRIITLRNVNVAGLSPVTWVANAGEVLDAIPTCGAMNTRIRFTVVNVVLAVTSRESSVVTVALVAIHKVHTDARVEAGYGLAFVNVGFALDTRVARLTDTFVLVNSIHTCCTILARFRGTLINIFLAVHTRVSRLAETAVVVDAFLACATVLTWLRQAFVHLNVAVGPRVSWPAEALV